MTNLTTLRQTIRNHHLMDEAQVLSALQTNTEIGATLRQSAVARATQLVKGIRNDDAPGLMEAFLAEFGLSTNEGVALMCLAEALLRVPDTDTMDALIEDKIAPSDWGVHLGHSSSSLVNASTWALMLTGKVLQDGEGMAAVMKGAVKRLGEPVIRAAVRRAMKEMGAQFVLGQTMDEAIKRGRDRQRQGYTYSYDMLGEAALTAKDTQTYFDAYANAIATLSPLCTSKDIRENPGISVKLSALHPRYEALQKARVMAELVPRVTQLARQAAAVGMGFNIDAEEADRLDLSLDVIEAVLRDPELAGWNGFGVVVQAYGKRAAPVLDWLHALAAELDRKIMVRLVKGAYWDTEVKRAQVENLPDFPVFTQKPATDVSYLCCAQKLLRMTDRIYPQFATHNAHTVAMIAEMADDTRAFEFQRLHGMGEALHDKVLTSADTRCRIYAPVGAHRDLLAYLVRRLLENGANSSFVNQIVDTDVPPEIVAADPFGSDTLGHRNTAVIAPADLYFPERKNSQGWDLHDPDTIAAYTAAREPFAQIQWQSDQPFANGETLTVTNPADPTDIVGTVALATPADAKAAISAAQSWDSPPNERAAALNRAADLYEEHAGELFALLAREAGKAGPDAVAELREAVDFLRYYAARAPEIMHPPRGLFTCISPWNFPLAIFTGQISAALAAGNGVLAKPAETTPLIASRAVELLHQAGIPATALQLLPGDGSTVGATLTSDPRIKGVAFTGSTQTAQAINRAMANHLDPTAPLIAETGGLNAMIVDSTALPEQAVRDIVMSAFRSTGQRCSALRMLYVQEDIADSFLEMLCGATDQLSQGDPWDLAHDLGPVIDKAAQKTINAHISQAKAENRVIRAWSAPDTGTFVAPAILRLRGISDLKREIFGPVLHVATFRASDIDKVVDAINATGYGLTFGMHSRIDDRVEQVTSRLRVGNIYINRNQIGAIVGSQPFGGEGLSGTGPKAGGPHYVPRFTQPEKTPATVASGAMANPANVQALLDKAKPADTAIATSLLPGPTGESNRLATYARGTVLCLGPGASAAAATAQALGCAAVIVAPEASGRSALDGTLDLDALATLKGFDAVILHGDDATLRAARIALANRPGRLIPLLAEDDLAERLTLERHTCIDTTAAGGNASLLSAVA